MSDRASLKLADGDGYAPGSLIALAARASDRDAFAIGRLRSGGSIGSLSSGRLRLDEMRKQHGKSTVNSTIDRVRKTTLDEKGRLIGDEFEGRTPKAYLLRAFPLDPDPVRERLARGERERAAREVPGDGPGDRAGGADGVDVDNAGEGAG